MTAMEHLKDFVCDLKAELSGLYQSYPSHKQISPYNPFRPDPHSDLINASVERLYATWKGLIPFKLIHDNDKKGLVFIKQHGFSLAFPHPYLKGKTSSKNYLAAFDVLIESFETRSWTWDDVSSYLYDVILYADFETLGWTVQRSELINYSLYCWNYLPTFWTDPGAPFLDDALYQAYKPRYHSQKTAFSHQLIKKEYKNVDQRYLGWTEAFIPRSWHLHGVIVDPKTQTLANAYPFWTIASHKDKNQLQVAWRVPP